MLAPAKVITANKGPVDGGLLHTIRMSTIATKSYGFHVSISGESHPPEVWNGDTFYTCWVEDNVVTPNNVLFTFKVQAPTTALLVDGITSVTLKGATPLTLAMADADLYTGTPSAIATWQWYNIEQYTGSYPAEWGIGYGFEAQLELVIP